MKSLPVIFAIAWVSFSCGIRNNYYYGHESRYIYRFCNISCYCFLCP